MFCLQNIWAVKPLSLCFWVLTLYLDLSAVLIRGGIPPADKILCTARFVTSVLLEHSRAQMFYSHLWLLSWHSARAECVQQTRWPPKPSQKTLGWLLGTCVELPLISLYGSSCIQLEDFILFGHKIEICSLYLGLSSSKHFNHFHAREPWPMGTGRWQTRKSWVQEWIWTAWLPTCSAGPGDLGKFGDLCALISSPVTFE